MKSQSCFRVVVVVAAMMLINSGILSAEEPAKNPQAAQPQNTPSATVELATDPVTAIWTAELLNFVANTHANPLGVEVAPVDKALSAQLGLAENNGVVITAVAPDSEAAKALLNVHDVVLKVGDRPVIKSEKFHDIVKSEQGKEVQVQIIRRGKPVKLKVKMPSAPEYELAIQPVETFSYQPENQYRIGLTLAAADDTLRSQLRLASGEGLVVTDVVADGPAAKAGVKKHDVLTMLDGKRLTTVEAINSQVQSIKDGKVTVVFVRGGQEMSRELAPQLGTTPAVGWQLSNAALANSFLSEYQNRNLAWQHFAALQPNTAAFAAANRLTGQPYVQWTPTTVQSLQAKLATPADQIAALKKQVAEMQKTLQALEAAIQPPTQKQAPAESPK